MYLQGACIFCRSDIHGFQHLHMPDQLHPQRFLKLGYVYPSGLHKASGPNQSTAPVRLGVLGGGAGPDAEICGC